MGCGPIASVLGDHMILQNQQEPCLSAQRSSSLSAIVGNIIIKGIRKASLKAINVFLSTDMVQFSSSWAVQPPCMKV